MKNFRALRVLVYALSIMVLIISLPQLAMAQVAEQVTFLDEIRQFLNVYYITEAAFLAVTVGITEFISRAFSLSNKSVIMGISLAVTMAAALVGFFLKVGIFAEISLFKLMVFVIMKTFSGNGLYDWIRLIFSMKGKNS